MGKKRKHSEALEYHAGRRPGKIQIKPTKPTATQHDLSLAYTPGVAEPCLAIAKNPDDGFLYTNRGNLVAVVSNGTAVLGLGDIGALAGKPVMEGKAVLFKRFADIDVFDLELDSHEPDDIIHVCQMLEPTFGGINLEDIKAPECFYIEEELKTTMHIPVFHDDQHGTAIIAAAGILNGLELTGRDLETTTVVINGAGAAGISTARHLMNLRFRRENIMLCDSKGVISTTREDLNPYKAAFARDTDCGSLADAMEGSDVFIGVSVRDAVTADMVKSMAHQPLILALANPDPEIPYDVARAARPDAIVATGRSDFPNQVNNVLGFPFIFRGALDVRARKISDGMKVAASYALAALAKEPVPDTVLKAYQLEELHFGPEYIIPKPFDPRVLWTVAPTVAKAATDEGLARVPLSNVGEYRQRLRARFQAGYSLIHGIMLRAQKEPKRVVFTQGCEPNILRACRRILDERIGRPIILGKPQELQALAESMFLDMEGIEVVDPRAPSDRHEHYAQVLFEVRQRKGMTLTDARRLASRRNVFAALMLREGDADALMGGYNSYYPDTLRPALRLIPLEQGRTRVSAVYIVVIGDRPYFLADCAVNHEPTSEQLAEIALSTAHLARTFGVDPQVALLSYSNFGSAKGSEVERVRKAVQLCHEWAPGLALDGEMHADTAVVEELMRSRHPFSRLTDRANILVFPNLSGANAAYKLLHHLGGAEVIGPILTGLAGSVHVIQRDAEVGHIVNLAAIAVIDAQRKRLAREGAGASSG